MLALTVTPSARARQASSYTFLNPRRGADGSARRIGRLGFAVMPDSKVALITGAGRGIGREIALTLAREGYATGLIARTQSQLEETAAMVRAAGSRALVTPTDVARREQVAAAVAAVERELGPIAVLVNNAGAYQRKRFTEISEEDFDFQLK